MRNLEALSSLERSSKVAWTVERYGVQYKITGGKQSGGDSKDWYIEGEEFSSPIRCGSMSDALRLLNSL